MIPFIARRMMLAALSIWFMSMIAFTVIQLPPGDSVDAFIEDLMEQAEGSMVAHGEFARERADALREYMGLDKPMVYRYAIWVWRMFHLDFGYSFLRAGGAVAQVKVTDLVQDRLWLTIILAGATGLISFFAAFPIGIYSAIRQHSPEDYAVTLIGFIGMSVPDFLLGLVLMYIGFAWFGWSVGGLFSGDMEGQAWGLAKVVDLLKHIWVPILIMGTSGLAGGIRILRNNLLDELRKPYVVAARAKGMPGWKVILKYPLRVAMNPMISGIGGLLPGLMSSSVIISVILSLPTLGPLLLRATLMQDVYTAGFAILMMGVLTIIGVLISDIMLVIVDPRIKMWQ